MQLTCHICVWSFVAIRQRWSAVIIEANRFKQFGAQITFNCTWSITGPTHSCGEESYTDKSTGDAESNKEMGLQSFIDL